MAYCSIQDLIARFGETELVELTDEQNLGVIDEEQIAQVISDVDGFIDGYLSGRYTLPLASIPASLTRAACHLVRYDLYDDPPPHVQKRFDQALAWLRDLSAGRGSLGINQDGSQPATSDTVSMSSGGNVFNRVDKGFI